MKRRNIIEVYNILSKTTTEGLEGDKVCTMLVTTSKMRKIAEDGEALIKSIDDKCPKEIKELKEFPKGEDERTKIMLAQNRWREAKSEAENQIMSEEVEFESHFMTQEETLAFIAKQGELKTTEKATLLEWLSK